MIAGENKTDEALLLITNWFTILQKDHLIKEQKKEDCNISFVYPLTQYKIFN